MSSVDSKKTIVKNIQDSDNVTVSTFSSKSVSEKYQKKSHLEHIFDIPDTYIGSTEEVTQTLWFFNEETDKMELKDITYIPGLYKIFDEVLVNANDHKVRCPAVKNIKVDIDEASGKISVWNDGDGIDVEVHEATNVYVPEMLFGHLLTSANYDAAEEKLTGGKNGYGAKLTNIFSTWFRIETVDGTRNKRYIQEFSNNMKNVEPPKITSVKVKPYTCIEFIPDFKRFKLAGFTPDILKVFKKRVYDLAATTKDVTIHLNGKKLAIKNFEKYMDLYIGADKKAVPRVYEIVNDRWEVGACTSPDGTFQHISFVNGIWTMKGGKHVDYISGMLSRRVCKYINEKKKKLNIKESYIQNNIWIFVRCLIVNPSFSSQTKEELTTVSTKFGSKCDISDDFIEKLAKSGVMEKAIELMTFKERDSLKKTDGKKRITLAGIPKLDDANKAGGAESSKCTLILTEGDSAKASAVSGLSVVGRDYYGVFPLKGKLLNVRDATSHQIKNNEEINQIKKILGLQQYEKDSMKAKQYDDIKELRYGRIMIMTDADVDGSHIKGLLFNFFHHHWPSLLKVPNFVISMKTPLVKLSKGRNKHMFYSLNEYEEWKKANKGGAGWEIKYYKGLGTSTSEEFKEYFRGMEQSLVEYTWNREAEEAETGSITLAFQKDKANDRKKWLNAYNADPDHGKREILARNPSYTDFIHNEMVHFSNYDNIRSIPNMLDGLKPSQRKVLFGCFKRNLRKEVKVAQLSGYISEHASYHHGEVSLQGTIIGMAQDFVGSNNVNLLVPNGQFGTRIQGGKDNASPRYIFTQLSDITSHLFNEHDSPLLKQLEDDGMPIEPEHYIPILPMVLVNGTDGIGTGFRSKTPCYNPMDIVRQFIQRLKHTNEPTKEFTAIHPWYRGFKGTIEQVEDVELSDDEDDEISVASTASTKVTAQRRYISRGLYKVKGDTIEITELPVGVWTQNYKEFIEEAMEEHSGSNSSAEKDKEKKRKKYGLPIVNYDNHSTDYGVRFVIKLEKGWLAENEASIEKKFKLAKSISTSSMYLYDEKGVIRHYNSPEEIMENFYGVRLGFYVKRKEHLLKKLMRECIILKNKVKFIEAALVESIKWNKSQEETEEKLKELGLWRLDTERFDLSIDFQTGESNGEGKPSYHYLLEMKIWSLTKEKVEKLKKEFEEKRVEYDALEKKSVESIWLDDLEMFEEVYQTWIADMNRKAEEDVAQESLDGAKKKGKVSSKETAAKPKKVAIKDIM